MTRILNWRTSLFVAASFVFQQQSAVSAFVVGGTTTTTRTTAATPSSYSQHTPSSSSTTTATTSFTRPSYVLKSTSPFLRKTLSVHQQHSHKIVEFLMSDIMPSTVPEHTHIVILPGFGTNSEDYTKRGSLKPNLMNRGLWSNNNVHVLPVERVDWLTNTIIKGMVMNAYDFFNGQIKPNSPAYSWYLNMIANEIERIDQQVKSEYGDDAKAKIVLLGHSAGGWLARAAIGYGSEQSSQPSSNVKQIDLENVLGIVTLGSPHIPATSSSKSTTKSNTPDMTGGALRYTNEQFPGAYHNDKLFYVTTAGNAIEGSGTHTLKRRLAYHSYKQVSGFGKCVGDGIVPTSNAHLDGADVQINLHNVYHAPELIEKGQNNNNNEIREDAWYGSDNILDEWFRPMLKVLEQRQQRQHRNILHFQQ